MRNPKAIIAIWVTLVTGCGSSSETGDSSRVGNAGDPVTGGSVNGFVGQNAGTPGFVGGIGGLMPVTEHDGGVSAGGLQQGRGGMGVGGVAGGGGPAVGAGGGVVSGLGGLGIGGKGMGGAAAVGPSQGGQGMAGAPSAGASAGGVGEAGAANGGRANGGSGPLPSPGCSAEVPLESGTYTMDVAGVERKYVLDLPSDYDPSHPYAFVFVWHALGGSADQVVSGNYDGLKPLSQGTTIFVAPDGLMGTAAGGVDAKGWHNENGNDMMFLEQMLETFESGLCIDENRFFSTGFSFGGMMSYAVGCGYSNVFRAIAPASGKIRGPVCDQDSWSPIAVFGIHGDSDTFVDTSLGRDARDVFLERNHCGTETEPVDPSPCVAYLGCDEGAPVYWCEFQGEHQQWSQAPEAIWNFFSRFQ